MLEVVGRDGGWGWRETSLEDHLFGGRAQSSVALLYWDSWTKSQSTSCKELRLKYLLENQGDWAGFTACWQCCRWPRLPKRAALSSWFSELSRVMADWVSPGRQHQKRALLRKGVCGGVSITMNSAAVGFLSRKCLPLKASSKISSPCKTKQTQCYCTKLGNW